ncbi:MAG: histidine phosphatase family protein [Desulfomonile tiedjei]|nr:histidine phosphatase family protein [Desulfomonile tiedjei]
MHKREIYLLRHGEIDRNYETRFVGHIDLALTENGVLQAQRWQSVLAGCAFGTIYCSDLMRSLRTAQIIADGTNSRVQVARPLREINLGEWDGLARDDVRARFPNAWRQRGEDFEGYRPPGGESFSDLSARVVPFFEQVVRRANGRELIVGHAGVNRVILCHVLGLPLANLLRIGQDYGCLNIIERVDGLFRVKVMNARVERDPLSGSGPSLGKG